MKIKSNILKCFTIAIIGILCVFTKNTPVISFASNSSFAVVEKVSGRVLYEENANQKLPMASTTKILTAITVIDNYDINKQITVPSCGVGIEGSSVYLQEGEVYTVEDLLYGLMLRSGNDCATTLAEVLAGSQEDFVNLMNQKAISCGATNSNFVNPHGLHDDNHYTTAIDLANITRYALLNETFKKIVSTKNYVASEIKSGVKRFWVNKNKMLFSFEGATGVKTGFTKKSGRCLVSSAERNGMELICVVLNESDHYNLSKTLLTDAFNNYRLVKLFDKEKFNYKIPNEDSTKFYQLKVNRDFYYPISKNEKITAQINLPKFIEEVKGDKPVGEIKIYASKQLIFFENIYTLIYN